MRRFRARFIGTRVVSSGTPSRRGRILILRGLTLTGRLDGQLVGSRALAQFDHARFVAAFTLTGNTVTRVTTMQGLALATFGGAARSCLRIRLTRRGDALPLISREDCAP